MSTIELPRIAPAVRRRPAKRFPRWDRMAVLFLLPWFVHLALFTLYPLALALYGSVSDWDILSDRMDFVGLQYFGDLLHDEFFFQTLHNTAVYLIIQVPLSIILGLCVAT